MSDALAVLGTGGVLGVGLGGAIALAKLGLPRTYVRDLVHVGAGVWVLGFPLWSSPAWPIAITVAAAAVMLVGPRALREAMTSGDERWSGIAVYCVAYAALTAIAFTDRAFPAGAGLLALSLGDGVGGAVGRRFGRHRFRVAGAKDKSVEGTLTVAVMSAVGIAIAARWLGADVGIGIVLVASGIAAVVEAIAPRGTDNALVPLAVWTFLRLAG